MLLERLGLDVVWCLLSFVSLHEWLDCAHVNHKYMDTIRCRLRAFAERTTMVRLRLRLPPSVFALLQKYDCAVRFDTQMHFEYQLHIQCHPRNTHRLYNAIESEVL